MNLSDHIQIIAIGPDGTSRNINPHTLLRPPQEEIRPMTDTPPSNTANMSPSNTPKAERLLNTLATDWGYVDPLDMIEDYIHDGLMPAICATSCGYSTEMEPDQTRGWCEHCCSNTVVSAAILAGVI